MTTLATDTFIRTNQSGWGTASDGSTYTMDTSGVVSTTNIASNEGTAVVGNDLYAQISSGTSAPVNILIRCATDSNGTNIGVFGRYSSGVNGYLAYLHSQTFNLDKIVSNAHTNLANTSFSYGANQYCWIRMVLSNTSLSATVWLDGNSEPGTPQLSVTDSTFSAAGRYGAYFQPGGGTGYYDHLTVTDNGSGVTTNTMSGTDSNTGSDLGGMQSWGVDALTGSDVGGIQQSGIEALTGSDVSGTQQWGIEALTGVDSLLFTDNAVLIENNIGADSLLAIENTNLVENNTISDSTLYIYNTVFTDNNTVSDILLVINNTVFVESNTTNDVGGMQQGGIDTLTGTDNLLATASTILIDNNTISDNTLYTVNTVLTENNTGIDDSIFIDTAVLIENNSVSDLGSIQQWTVDASTGSDINGVQQNGVEALSGADSLLAIDNTILIESNTIDDASSGGLTQQSAGITTNNMNGTDSSVGIDFGGMQSWRVDVSTGSDILIISSIYIPIEALNAVDIAVFLDTYSGVESNISNDSGSLSQLAVLPTIIILAVGYGRDGSALGNTRDGILTGNTHDGIAILKGA